MPGCRRLLMLACGLAGCLLSGCLRDTFPAEGRSSLADAASVVGEDRKGAPKRTDLSPPPAPSDYLVSRPSAVTPNLMAAPPVKPVEMRIKPQEPQAPPKPADPPEPRMEFQPAPPPKPDAPIVQMLRALLEHHATEDMEEQLRQYDPATRDTLLVLLQSAAQLDQGVERASPGEITPLVDRLNAQLTALRSRAQLTLDNMCFCSHIENFGQFMPLKPDHAFQPGEEARVYVQVRNFASRRERGGCTTVLKGRLEIYEENNRKEPIITWNSEPRLDFSWTPRQDYFINFGFRVPVNCPPGSYTVWIYVEDWTLAPGGEKVVAKSRIARSSLDFKVGGAAARQPHARIADVTPAR